MRKKDRDPRLESYLKHDTETTIKLQEFSTGFEVGKWNPVPVLPLGRTTGKTSIILEMAMRRMKDDNNK